MNELQWAWKERRSMKREIWVTLKNNRSFKSVHLSSKWKVKTGLQKLRDLLNSRKIRKIRSKMFFKKVLLKILNIPRKTPVLEPLFDKLADLLQRRCFPLSSFSYRTSLVVASDYRIIISSWRIISNHFLKHIQQISSISWKVY